MTRYRQRAAESQLETFSYNLFLPTASQIEIEICCRLEIIFTFLPDRNGRTEIGTAQKGGKAWRWKIRFRCTTTRKNTKSGIISSCRLAYSPAQLIYCDGTLWSYITAQKAAICNFIKPNFTALRRNSRALQQRRQRQGSTQKAESKVWFSSNNFFFFFCQLALSRSVFFFVFAEIICNLNVFIQ